LPDDWIAAIERGLVIAESEGLKIKSPAEWLAWGESHGLDRPIMKSGRDMWPLFASSVERYIEAGMQAIPQAEGTTNDGPVVKAEPKQSEPQGKVLNKRDHELHDLINQVFIKLDRPRNNSDVWEVLADSDNDKNEVIQEIYSDRIDWISRRGIEQTMKRKTFDNYLAELRKS